jgi:LmbE family N-acetylglucosaminyl deacetylase
MTSGIVEPPELDLQRVVALSPHFDDAVLSCAHALAAATEGTVVTVFGGRPAEYPAMMSDWDRACGFRPGDDVVVERRAENARALKALEVDDEVCELLDGQYRGPRRYRVDDVVAALAPTLERSRPTTVLVPLGLGHRDHALTCAAALALRSHLPGTSWVAYAEYPYAWREEDWEVKRIGRLRRGGYRLTPVLGIPPSVEPKASALAAYTSQLRGLSLGGDLARFAAAPEQLWRITDRPPPWTRARRRLAYEIERRRRRWPEHAWRTS